VDAAYRKAVIVLALALLLAACTRERPTPEPTATSALANVPPTPIQIQESAQSAPNAEPEVEPLSTGTPEAEATPTAVLRPETFQYAVQPGETLSSIAFKFDTDLETLRDLNALEGDNLYVGQPLYVPYVEGMTAEGMPTPTPGPFAYTIQPGDTLNGIALRFGINPNTIMEFNNLLDRNNLTVGMEIIIPNYQPPAEAGEAGAEPGDAVSPAVPGANVVHVVQAGQGLFEIAGIYGVSADAIIQANNLVDSNLLRVGQELIIPGVTQRDVLVRQGAVHVVQSGESLLGIAIRYGVTVEEILEFNGLTDPDALFEGQELIIPGS